METFSLPIHEVYDRFTRSELFMMAWRSQEQHHHLKLKLKKSSKGESNVTYKASRYGSNDIIPEGLPDHFFNAEGEVDLSKVTGREAHRYMASIGMPFPVMQTSKPNPSTRNNNA